MMLITNLYFLLSLLPCCVSFIYYASSETKQTTNQEGFEHERQQYIVHILSYSNYSVNILFYFIWSQKYREEFLKLFRKPNPKSFATEFELTKMNAKNILS